MSGTLWDPLKQGTQLLPLLVAVATTRMNPFVLTGKSLELFGSHNLDNFFGDLDGRLL